MIHELPKGSSHGAGIGGIIYVNMEEVYHLTAFLYGHL